MLVGDFTAVCRRGHDPITFDGDRKGFERHMATAHKAMKRAVGGAYYLGRRYPAMDAPRPGGLPNKYLRPARVPTTTEGLTKVLKDHDSWADRGTDGGRGVFAGVCDDWQTDERVSPADLTPGDVFELAARLYELHEVDPAKGWHLTMLPRSAYEQPQTGWVPRLALRGGATVESVVIVKRAA